MTPRSGQRARFSRARILIALAIVAAAAALFLYQRAHGKPGDRAGRPTGPHSPAESGRRSGPTAPHSTKPSPPSRAGGAGRPGYAPPRVAIVIDDVGFEEARVLELTRIGLSFTFAILPHQRFTRSLASRLSAEGYEVILHMPMEPLGFPALDPGEGSVGAEMTPREIRSAVERGLAEVPQAAGLNNHMGSRTTADPRAMRTVLEILHLRGLFFLDSRTTSESVGFTLAREMGVPALERGLFLDDRREASYIQGQVLSLLRKAQEEGPVVAIGHPDAVTVDVLKRSADLFRREHVDVVPASQLTLPPAGDPG